MRPILPSFAVATMRCLCMALVLVLPASAFAAGWDLNQLMQSLAANQSGRAAFTEQKFIALLDAPVVSSGELRYVAPDRLEKRTVKPRPESMTVQGDTLTLERGGKQRVIQLQDYPDIAVFIDSIRGTLAGDRRALEKAYRLSLQGDAAKWTLTLVPTDARIVGTVHRIEIGGTRNAVRRIEIMQTDGDRSVMTIDPVTTP